MGKKQMAAYVCVALDPDNCGSTVMGYVYKSASYKSYDNRRDVRSGGKVILSDCSRSITWEIGDGNDGGVAKLNRAIKALTVLRDAAKREQPKVRQLKRETDKHNRSRRSGRRRAYDLEI